MFDCSDCGLSFASEYTYKYHQRKTHQDTVKLFLQDGNVVSVARDTDGFFQCPVHMKQGKTPRFVFKHKECYTTNPSGTAQYQSTSQDIAISSSNTNDESQHIQPNIIAHSGSLELSLQNTGDVSLLLAKYNMGYDEINQWIYCITCKGIVSRNFNGHLKRVHKINISTHDWKKIIHSLQISLFERDLTLAYEPLSYLDTLDGYQCTICLICCLNIKSITQHCNSLHGLKSFEKCYVQSGDIGESKSYFRVQAQDWIRSQQHIQTYDSNQINTIIDTTMQALQSNITPHEDYRTREMFYSKSGWFVDSMEMKNFQLQRYYLYFECPRELETKKNEIIDYITKSIESIKHWDPLFKKRLGYSDKKKRNFTYLYSKNARRDYSSVFVKAIFFAINFCLRPIPYYTNPTTEMRDLVGYLLAEYSSINLIRFLFHLVTEKVSTSTRGMCILTIFMRLSCIRKDYSLLPPEYVSQIGSKLIYFMKMVYYLYCESDAEIGLQMFDKLIQMIQGDDLRFSTTIYIITADALHYASKLKKLPIIIETIPNQQINLKGIHVDFKNLTACYHNMMKEIKRLAQVLLMYKESPKIKTHQILDDLSQRSMGYSMKMDDIHTQQNLNQYMVKSVLNDATLKKKYIQNLQHNQIHWNTSEIQQYMKVYNDFIKNLCFMIHYVSGMPGRATEISTYKRTNGMSSQRNMYYSNQRIWFYVPYSKTNSLTESSKNIVRFLDKESSDIMLMDFFVFRPFIQVISTYLNINPDNTYSVDIFVINGNKMNERDIRDNFAYLFQRYSTIPLTFQQFRHFSKYISIKIGIKTFQSYYKGFLDGDDEQEQDDGDLDGDDSEDHIHGQSSVVRDPFSAQIGHSTRMGFLHYASVAGAHNEVTDMEIQIYMRCSNQWQDFIKNNQFISSKKQIAIAQHKDSSLQHIHTNTLQIENMDDIHHYQSHESLTRTFPNQPLEIDIAPASYPSVSQSQQSLILLQTLYKSPSVTFRNKYQHMAVDNALFTNNNMLVILPTGGGKSTLIWLNCLHHHTKSTLVIVPTVSLKNDLIDKAKYFSISVIDSIGDYRNQNLIIATTDIATTQSFVFFAQRLAHQNQLSRIFIDEAHTFVTDSTYRDCMKSLTMFASTMCPITLLTATAPVWIQNNLIQAFFPHQSPTVIRDSTNRPNLVYSCINDVDPSTIKQVLSEYHQILSQDERIICYLQTISAVDEWKTLLQDIPCTTYHSNIENFQRQMNTDLWKSGQVKVLLATSGFGLGVDYSQVRYVIIIDLPYSFEDYIQQCGRAGRDGKDAHTILFYSREKEMTRYNTFIQKDGKIKSDMFLKMMEYAETSHCRRQFISNYMDNDATTCFYDPINNRCDNCQSQHVANLDDHPSIQCPSPVQNPGPSSPIYDESILGPSDLYELAPEIEDETLSVQDFHLQTSIASDDIDLRSSKTVNPNIPAVIIDEHEGSDFWEAFFQQDMDDVLATTEHSQISFNSRLPTRQVVQISDLQESPKKKPNTLFTIKGIFGTEHHQESNISKHTQPTPQERASSKLLSSNIPESKRKTLSFGSEQSNQTVHTNTPKKIRTEQAPTTTSSSKGTLNSKFSESQAKYFKLQKYKSLCPVCLAKSEQEVEHKISKCPHMKGCCIKCQGNMQSPPHKISKDCPLIPIKWRVNDACYKCYFPSFIGGLDYHSINPMDDAEFAGCPNDFVMEYAIALFKYKRSRLPIDGKTFTQYYQWLGQKSDGLYNVAHVFLNNAP